MTTLGARALIDLAIQTGLDGSKILQIQLRDGRTVQQIVGEAAAAMGTATGAARLPRFVDGLRRISSSRSYRVFFDILPYALRNEGLRGRMACAYDYYRRLKRDWLRGRDDPSPEEEALAGVAELMTAVVDGLAIQEAIDDDFDARRAYAVLELMLQRSLPELLEAGLTEPVRER